MTFSQVSVLVKVFLVINDERNALTFKDNKNKVAKTLPFP